MHLDSAKAIREAINSGEHTFDEFMSVLDEANKFKDWLRTTNPDGHLIAEYYKAVSADSWLSRLPGKSMRIFIAAGLGVVLEALYPSGLGTAVAAAYSGVDSFLLEKLGRGWRPNQIVEGPLQKLKA